MKCGDDVEAVAARVILFEAAVDEIHDDENEKRNVRPDTEISPETFSAAEVHGRALGTVRFPYGDCSSLLRRVATRPNGRLAERNLLPVSFA